MSNHLGRVNCVRWSVDGRWLASGGDNSVIMIRMTFGMNHEKWGCVHMLRAMMAMFWISRSHLTANTLPLVVLTTLLFGNSCPKPAPGWKSAIVSR